MNVKLGKIEETMKKITKKTDKTTTKTKKNNEEKQNLKKPTGKRN